MPTPVWPTLFIPHGGGPCFFMDTPPAWPRDTWDGMAAFLRGLDGSLGRRPRAMVVVSGHWQAARPTLNTAARPSLLFDYEGFPPHTYRLTYPVDGAPDVAAEARRLLEQAGRPPGEAASRGLDPRILVPVNRVYPDADVPLVQLSLQAGLDPATHLAIGAALAPLRAQDVLIVGSGMSYHNLGAMFSGRGGAEAKAFDDWLDAVLTDPQRRDAALTGWQDAPGARDAHPHAEHLLPLMIAAGAARGEPAERIYTDRVLGKPMSGFRFGAPLAAPANPDRRLDAAGAVAQRLTAG